MKSPAFVKLITYMMFCAFLTNCSGTFFNPFGDSSSGSSSQGSTEEEDPYKKYRCRIVVKKLEGQDPEILLDFSGDGYLFISGVGECTYNKANNIEGPCDENKKLTIIQPDNNGLGDELAVDIDDIEVTEPGDHFFLCTTEEGIKLSIASDGYRVIIQE